MWLEQNSTWIRKLRTIPEFRDGYRRGVTTNLRSGPGVTDLRISAISATFLFRAGLKCAEFPRRDS